MSDELEKALKDGNIIDLDEKNHPQLPEEPSLPTTIHLKKDERYEQVNLPIGIEYYKSYHPLDFIHINSIISQISTLKLSDHEVRRLVDYILVHLPHLSKNEVFHHLETLITRFPSLSELLSLLFPNHKILFDTSNDTPSFHYAICLLAFGSFLTHKLFSQISFEESWISKNDVLAFVQGTNIERRFILKNYPSQASSQQDKFTRKIFLSRFIQHFDNAIEKISSSPFYNSFQSILNSEWSVIFPQLQSALLSDKWDTIHDKLKEIFPQIIVEPKIFDKFKSAAPSDPSSSSPLPALLNSEDDIIMILSIYYLYLEYVQ